MSNRIELGELETYLYASADILRGHVEASDYKSFVFPLLFFKRICDVYDEETANAIITHLADLKLVTENEGRLMRSAVSRNALALPISAKDVLRAAVLRNMLVQVFRNIEGGDRK